MAKVVIEVYKTKTADELSRLVADPASRPETGSALAASAAQAAAMACRAGARMKQRLENDSSVDYFCRNGEILRSYMVELIDRDVQCRNPMRKALKEGGPQEVEACRTASVSIVSELINMMSSLIDLCAGVKDLARGQECYEMAQAVTLAYGIMDSARFAVLSVMDDSVDDTTRYVARRENQLYLESYRQKAEEFRNRILEA